MAFKEKVQDFAARHGYGWGSYALAILLFPPAAVFIAWRKPGVSRAGRVAMTAGVAVLAPAIGVASLYMLKLGVDLARQWV